MTIDIVQSIFQSDIGVYTCEANNEMGSMFAVLNIEENDDLPETVEDELREAANMIRNSFNHQQASSAVIINNNIRFLTLMMLCLKMFY